MEHSLIAILFFLDDNTISLQKFYKDFEFLIKLV